MEWTPKFVAGWLFNPECGPRNGMIARWMLLRALGLIYFSAFFSLFFQIRGLIGPAGILPAGEYLQQVAEATGAMRYWYAPTLLWISDSSFMLLGMCVAGMLAAVLLTLNLWPRGLLAMCFVCFLSFVSAAREFSGYQSDGMLLEAGFLALFFAPGGLRPGLGEKNPPVRASLLLLMWEWFRIYFESGVAKIVGGDPQWRNFTAMDEYYQNGPLPTWIGWYAEHLPHWFHAATALGTLAVELVLVWTTFLPRRFRIGLFIVLSALQAGIILTANYTFLNYLVLALGILLLDDKFLARFALGSWRKPLERQDPGAKPASAEPGMGKFKALRIALTTVMLGWIFYATVAEMLWMMRPGLPLLMSPVTALEPFRVANRYGLFAVMTRGRYEIEFQGSSDGKSWVAYPFRFKPQELAKAPGIYAPYQPRFDWNLWFASLDTWREEPIVVQTERRLLLGNKDVLALFAGNPFPGGPPKQVRAVLWQYWFSTRAEKQEKGLWWRRQLVGLYAPSLELEEDGRIVVTAWPGTGGVLE